MQKRNTNNNQRDFSKLRGPIWGVNCANLFFFDIMFVSQKHSTDQQLFFLLECLKDCSLLIHHQALYSKIKCCHWFGYLNCSRPVMLTHYLTFLADYGLVVRCGPTAEMALSYIGFAQPLTGLRNCRWDSCLFYAVFLLLK